jgi:hypothetical protein
MWLAVPEKWSKIYLYIMSTRAAAVAVLLCLLRSQTAEFLAALRLLRLLLHQ